MPAECDPVPRRLLNLPVASFTRCSCRSRLETQASQISKSLLIEAQVLAPIYLWTFALEAFVFSLDQRIIQMQIETSKL